MKRYLALLLVVVLAFGLLTACGKKKEKNRLEMILEAKKIVVGTSPDFAPMEFIDISRGDGPEKYVGLDIEFARYIAKELGVELEIKPMDFGAALTAASAGTIDLTLMGLAWKEERAESMELTDFYNVQNDPRGQGILVLKKDADKYKTAADFAGKVVAVQEASLQKSLLEEQVPGAEVKLISKTSDGVMMLVSGKVDAVGLSGSNGDSYCLNYPEVVMSDFYYDYESQGNVGGMKKGEVELCAKINEIIKKAAAEGLFEKWYQEAQDLVNEIGWEND